jgi:hypothetical protein
VGRQPSSFYIILIERAATTTDLEENESSNRIAAEIANKEKIAKHNRYAR